MEIGLSHFLILATILFGLGIFVISTRKNVIAILMGIELVLNAANINFVAFNRYLHGGNIDGHIFSIFVIILAAAEAVVGMAIVLMLFRRYKHVDAVNLDNLKQ